ncbi:elongation factor P [bacterium E08(2017)]|nr:elongation factor P [bacterium E08(2017)]
MFTSSDLRKGLKIEIDGVPYAITEYNFQKPGKGQAIYTVKLKNMINGSTQTKTYRPNDRIDKPNLTEKTMVYSYQDADDFIFMDDNYEQITLKGETLGDNKLLLTEDIEVFVLYHNDTPIDIQLPNFVEKEIVETEPGARGNTATNVLKPAKVEGGYEISVPLFINQGDIVKIDTRTGEYADRVLKK